MCVCIYVGFPTDVTGARRRRMRGDFGDAEANAAHGQRRPSRRSGERGGACAGSQSPAPGGRSRAPRPRCTRRKGRAFSAPFARICTQNLDVVGCDRARVVLALREVVHARAHRTAMVLRHSCGRAFASAPRTRSHFTIRSLSTPVHTYLWEQLVSFTSILGLSYLYTRVLTLFNTSGTNSRSPHVGV
jgi:hypothetical protein